MVEFSLIGKPGKQRKARGSVLPSLAFLTGCSTARFATSCWLPPPARPARPPAASARVGRGARR